MHLKLRRKSCSYHGSRQVSTPVPAVQDVPDELTQLVLRLHEREQFGVDKIAELTGKSKDVVRACG